MKYLAVHPPKINASQFGIQAMVEQLEHLEFMPQIQIELIKQFYGNSQEVRVLIQRIGNKQKFQ